MKLKIHSKQDYGTHQDAFDEEFEATAKPDELGNLIISFENGYIQICDKKIIRANNDNKFEIIEGESTEVDYDTEHGMIVLDLKGIEVKVTGNATGIIASAKYEISIVGVEPYTNEIVIELE